MTLAVVYMGDQPLVFSTALDVQKDAGRRVAQLEVDVGMPPKWPDSLSLSKVFVELMTFLNGDGRAEEADRLPRTGEFSGNFHTDMLQRRRHNTASIGMHTVFTTYLCST